MYMITQIPNSDTLNIKNCKPKHLFGKDEYGRKKRERKGISVFPFIWQMKENRRKEKYWGGGRNQVGHKKHSLHI